MHIVVMGLNYRTAPVEVREQFTFSAEMLPEALAQLKQTKSILECAIVSTCNRTEIYAVVDRVNRYAHYMYEFMERWFGISRQQFAPYIKTYQNEEAIHHLFKVASGLDSMVIGETQILGQIREAFLLAQKEKTTGTLFNTLFKQAITTAKKAHTDTQIGEHAVSVSYAAVELGKRIFGSFQNRNVMIIGAGKMSELTVKHLHSSGVGKVVVANRTLEKAQELASKFAGIACTLEQINASAIEHQIDVIISSTGFSGYVLTHEDVVEIMKQRKSRPLFMIDIAVPRDLDPRINDINNVFLYDIDDLQTIVDRNLELRKKEAAKVEVMNQEGIAAFEQWMKTLGVSPLIRALQDKATTIHAETMDNLLRKLPDLSEHEAKVIRKLSKSMVNQMLLDPILRIKELAAQKGSDDSLELFTKIFALEPLLEEQQIRLQAELAAKAAEAEEENKTSMPAIQPQLIARP